jgi:U5 small nuclear ribonucleoprotein component
MLRDHVRSPLDNAETKVRHTYSGDLDGTIGEAMLACDPDGPLMVHVTKLYVVLKHKP